MSLLWRVRLYQMYNSYHICEKKFTIPSHVTGSLASKAAVIYRTFFSIPSATVGDVTQWICKRFTCKKNIKERVWGRVRVLGVSLKNGPWDSINPVRTMAAQLKLFVYGGECALRSWRTVTNSSPPKRELIIKRAGTCANCNNEFYNVQVKGEMVPTVPLLSV